MTEIFQPQKQKIQSCRTDLKKSWKNICQDNNFLGDIETDNFVISSKNLTKKGT